MLDDSELIPVFCETCQQETLQSIRSLKAMAGQAGCICAIGRHSVQDYSSHLALIIEDNPANLVGKLRIKKP